MILKIVEIPHALNSTHIGYNAQLSFINGVETIEEIPKLIKRNGLDFILSNKVIIVMHYVKKETLIER